MKKLLLIIAVTGVACWVQAQTLLYYWNFNTGVPPTDQSWVQPIAATQGDAQITYTFTEAFSFTGTTINGVDGETNGGSFCPRGGLDNVNNGAYFTLTASTVGYDEIILTYPTRRTSTGFSSQEVKYTIDGTNWITRETIDISAYENNWVPAQLVSVSFSGIAGVGNNPNFAIRIVLTGASSAVGNNRFDNIRISGSAQGGVATPTFNPPGGQYSSPITVTISCATPGASIYYTTDGSNPTPSSIPYTAPIPLSTTTTLKAIGVLPGMENSPVATATYSFPVTVNNLSTLRTMPADGTTVYHVTGEVILTFQQTFRNQKFLQDAGAGILIDDLNGVNTTAFNIGDGITGITGKISEYGGMLQFVPTVTLPAASSSNNPIVPITVSYDQLINSFDTYESRVVKVLEVMFVNPTGNFANGTVYASYDQDSDFDIRTTFYDVDYINTPIPTTPKDITGIPNSRVDGEYFTPRWLSDFEDPAGTVSAPTFSPPAGVYYQPVNVTLSCATPGASIHYTLDGSDPNQSSTPYTAPITINGTTTIKAIAYLTGFPPSAISTAQYSFPTAVATLADLRLLPTGAVYRVNGEVVVTFTQSFRNQKFVQDDSAGILIDDPNGIITTVYSIGDGITNLIGTLTEYGGMLELVPVTDPGPPSSINNWIIPLEITLAQFNSSFETYESRVVTIQDVAFSNPTGNFANGTVYPIQDQGGANTANFRTTFYDVNYIGVSLQPWLLNITGIPNSRTDGNYFTACWLEDFQIAELLPPLVFSHTVLGGSSLAITVGFIAPNNITIPEGLADLKIYRDNVVIAQAWTPVLELIYNDTNIPPGTHVYYATAVYDTGESDPTESFTYIVTANPEDTPPAPRTELLGNYPNPFNPSTSIRFSLQEAGPVRIDIFNARGQLVRTLVNENLPSGTHTAVWDGADATGATVSSGVYYYRMHKGSYSSTRKMLILK